MAGRAPNSFDIKLNGEPYICQNLKLGNAVTEPAPEHELGTAIVETLADGLGGRVNRGTRYYNINSLIPTVEGELIFPPRADVGAEFSLTGAWDYTPGIFHHSNPAGQYIALGTRIYRLNLTDFAGITYTLVAGSDCTAAPMSNPNARYTGGAFIHRDRIYFGIENALNGGAIGMAYIDFVANDALAVVLNDDVRGFSYGASARGRVFIAQNRAHPEPTRLKWASRMDIEYSVMNTTTDIHGFSTGEFVYAVEHYPRVSWVMMLGGSALFFREDGSVLASDEAGFMGIATPASQSSGTVDKTQGFGSVPYIDGAAFRVFAGGPHHLNPVNLVVRSLSAGIVQDITTEVQDPDIFALCAVGEHLFMAGENYLYDCIWRDRPVVHKLWDISQLTASPSSYVSGALTQQGGILAATMFNAAAGKLQQLHMEVLPSIRKSVQPFAGVGDGWLEPGIIVGPTRAANMTKMWLQVRFPFYTRVNFANSLSFTSELVDELKPVDIATVSQPGPVATPITASPDLNRLGRTLSFRLHMNVLNALGYNEKLYLPMSVDFLWVPSDTDYVTLEVLASGEQVHRSVGTMVRKSARFIVDELMAMEHTVVPLTFSDGNPAATWTMFIEKVEATRQELSESALGGQVSYVVTLLCRRL